MSRRPRRVFYTNRITAALLDPGVVRWLGPLLMAVLILCGMRYGHIIGALSFAAVPLVWLLGKVGGEQVRAWNLLPSGIALQHRHGRVRVVPWEMVREVEETADAVVVVTETETLRFAGRRKDHPLLAAALRERMAQRTAAPVAVPPEQVAAWLGIGLDGAIRLRRRWWQRLGGATLFGGLAVFFLAMLLQSDDPFVPWQALVPLLCYGPLAFVAARPHEVIVTPHGLWGRGVRLAWDEVEHVERPRDLRQAYIISGADRAIILHGPDAARVCDAAEQVIAARERGDLLPRLADVPEHALSRAETAEIAAERGLSRTE